MANQSSCQIGVQSRASQRGRILRGAAGIISGAIAAAALGDPLEGGAGLALFGLGTIPALLGVSVADELLVRHRSLVNRLSQAFILLMGIWFTWQGLAGQ